MDKQIATLIVSIAVASVTILGAVATAGWAISARIQDTSQIVQRDISELRTDIRQDIQGLRQEIGLLRDGVKQDIRDLRQEVGSLRSDVKQDIRDLRQEVGSLRDDVKQDIQDLRDSSDPKSESNLDNALGVGYISAHQPIISNGTPAIERDRGGNRRWAQAGHPL
ncbi:MAG: hypothetical protein ISN28_05740 [Ectothiorhodospiraceae bacterium AqS1]|nr:hypothetical protein [Ectothiorhodospiraceae bacterium AqS1]